MRQSLRILCMAALTLTILTDIATAKDAKLTFALPEGLSLHYKLNFQEEISIESFEIVTNATSEVDMKWVEKTDDGNAKVSITFSNVVAAMQRGSDLEDMDLGIDGAEVWVMVSPRGEVEKVIPQALLNQEETDRVEGLVEFLFAFFSIDKVGEGDSWKRDITREGSKPDDPPRLTGKAEFFLDEFKKSDGREVAKIVEEVTFQINLMIASDLVTAKGKGDQETVVALDGGYIVKAKSFAQAKGKLKNGADMSMVYRIECQLK